MDEGCDSESVGIFVGRVRVLRVRFGFEPYSLVLIQMQEIVASQQLVRELARCNSFLARSEWGEEESSGGGVGGGHFLVER